MAVTPFSVGMIGSSSPQDVCMCERDSQGKREQDRPEDTGDAGERRGGPRLGCSALAPVSWRAKNNGTQVPVEWSSAQQWSEGGKGLTTHMWGEDMEAARSHPCARCPQGPCVSSLSL